MTEQLTVNSQPFILSRYPLRKNDPLRAWDAADEYILQHVFDNNILASGKRILIVNDNFGALTVPLSNYSTDTLTDSYIAKFSIQKNHQHNSENTHDISFIYSTEKLKVNYDIVIIKVPKNQALLEDQLFKIKSHVTPETIIIAAGMVKSIHRSTLQLFESLIGPTTTSLAKKKARLIFPTVDAELKSATNPYPKTYLLDDYQLSVVNHANVFSRQKLDIGTRFFLQNLPHSTQQKDVIDLGCGNGLLGVVYALNHPNSRLTFIDESYMAIASAQENYKNALGCHNEDTHFLVGG